VIETHTRAQRNFLAGSRLDTGDNRALSQRRDRRHLVKTKILTIALIGLGAACGGSDTSDNDAVGAVPSAEMLSLDVDSAGSAQALSVTPSQIDAATQELTQDIADAINLAQDRIDALRASATKKTVSVGRNECVEWDATADNIAYRLQSCDHNGARDIFFFSLQGRAADATDADFVVLAAGEGAALPNFNGGRRGHGRIGFDFDAWTALHGSGPQGKIAIGYRAAGRARSLNVAFDKFALAGKTPHSALLRYHRVVDVGGRISFATYADVIEPVDGGGYQVGQDGIEEYARVALAWAAGKGARVSAVVCGGSVGTSSDCVREVECFTQTSAVTFEDIRSGNVSASFNETTCPSVSQEPGDPPSTTDVTVSAGTDADVPGPSVDEPSATSDE